MARFDKYNRQLFSNQMVINNALRITKKDGDEKFTAEVVERGATFLVSAVDLDDGRQEVPKVGAETPNLEAMALIGKYDPVVADAFATMMIGIFEAMEDEDYINKVIEIDPKYGEE